ncbi:MAG: sulfite exporter TauE/SafE family protein [Flavobacteriaceae bacterium]|nr:sulfite exporter TauE/SafE family protein [Flavobacteriaceae bacterium]
MLLSAIVLGLLSSFHCIGMCGPIAFVLPVDRVNKSRGAYQTALYHVGRLLAYSSIGALFGLLGRGLYLSGFQQRLSILLGVAMITLVLIPARIFNKYNLSRPVYSFINKVKSKLGLYLKKTSNTALFSIGFFNGFLPCGMVYFALVGAVATSEVHLGAFYMFLFGVGTIPVMSFAIYSKNIFSVDLRKRITKAIPVFVVILGLLFILRGMGLGIPYVSPKDIKLQVHNTPIECVD